MTHLCELPVQPQLPARRHAAAPSRGAEGDGDVVVHRARAFAEQLPRPPERGGDRLEVG